MGRKRNTHTYALLTRSEPSSCVEGLLPSSVDFLAERFVSVLCKNNRKIKPFFKKNVQYCWRLLRQKSRLSLFFFFILQVKNWAEEVFTIMGFNKNKKIIAFVA